MSAIDELIRDAESSRKSYRRGRLTNRIGSGLMVGAALVLAAVAAVAGVFAGTARPESTAGVIAGIAGALAGVLTAAQAILHPDENASFNADQADQLQDLLHQATAARDSSDPAELAEAHETLRAGLIKIKRRRPS